MQTRLRRFRLTLMIGYGVVVLLLAGGMILTTQRFDVIATDHVNRIRVEEAQTTYAERLRWSGEAIVATGRGYMISGDAVFLRGLEHAERNFDRGIRALNQGSANVASNALVMAVAEDARAFRDRQEILVDAMRSEDQRTLAHRFEAELVPLQRNLSASLDRLIDYKEAAIDELYVRVAAERSRLRERMNALVGILVVASLAIAAYVANLLGRSYRKEQRALETTRKAVAARDELMGMVAHDLRNPLASISLHAEVMREEVDTAATKKHAARIEAVAQRMESLIASMLDVATIESGHFAVSPKPCAVSELADTIVELFRDAADRKHIKLESPAIASKFVVNADRDRVLQVLQNLVGNAIKFTHHGGRVSIAAERDGEVVRFRVSDNGPGIARDELPAVFDRFWRHEARGKMGTGLGLFIAKGIVDAHGGRIWVDSGRGHGATFYFTLPLIEAVADQPEAAASLGMLNAERGLQGS